MKTKICSNCNEEKEISEFGKDKYNLDRLSYKCKECQNDYQNTIIFQKYRKKYYKIYHKTNKGKKILKKAQQKFIQKITFCCKDCGIQISLPTVLYGEGRCKKCSRTLKFRNIISKAQKGIKESLETRLKISKTTKGKNNPRYINGLSKSKYSFYFSDELKLKIRKRDKFICQLCGMTEKEHIIKFKKVLTIHHIDYNKQNCKEDNLIALCLICNCKANGNKDFDRNFWFAYYTYQIENKLSI